VRGVNAHPGGGPGTPFGGVKQSGIGVEGGGQLGLKEFVDVTTLRVAKTGAPHVRARRTRQTPRNIIYTGLTPGTHSQQHASGAWAHGGRCVQVSRAASRSDDRLWRVCSRMRREGG